MATLRANKFSSEWLSTDAAELGIVGILRLTLRALHEVGPPSATIG
jgi:hypothetical protein